MPENEVKNAIEHGELKASVKALHIQMESNAEIQQRILKDIEQNVSETLAQAKKTNGRVTVLEQEMEIVRTLKRRKWLLAIIIFGVMKIYEIVDIKFLWTKLLSLI